MQNKFVVECSHNDQLLSRYLAESMSCSGRQIKALLDQRNVLVNGQRIWMAKHRLQTGDVVEVANAPEKKRDQKITILYEDEACLVANKPSGMLSNGPESCEIRLRKQLGLKTLYAVHRIDKETSGCLLFAKTSSAERALIHQFKKHEVTKQYTALVQGKLKRKEGVLNKAIDGQRAETRYRVISSNELASLIHVRIITGKKHQIRRHFLKIGHPVLGDKEYGGFHVKEPRFRNIPRQMLHASQISFLSPAIGKPIHVSAQEPSDFKESRTRFTPKNSKTYTRKQS